MNISLSMIVLFNAFILFQCIPAQPLSEAPVRSHVVTNGLSSQIQRLLGDAKGTAWEKNLCSYSLLPTVENPEGLAKPLINSVQENSQTLKGVAPSLGFAPTLDHGCHLLTTKIFILRIVYHTHKSGGQGRLLCRPTIHCLIMCILQGSLISVCCQILVNQRMRGIGR